MVPKFCAQLQLVPSHRTFQIGLIFYDYQLRALHVLTCPTWEQLGKKFSTGVKCVLLNSIVSIIYYLFLDYELYFGTYYLVLSTCMIMYG